MDENLIPIQQFDVKKLIGDYTLKILKKAKKVITIDENGVVYEMSVEDYINQLKKDGFIEQS